MIELGNSQLKLKVIHAAYEYADSKAVNEEEMKELFYSTLREAIDHVRNKRMVVQ